MGILKLTEYVIEYLIISSALFFLMSILSFFAVTAFRVKGAIKILLYALVFILPVIYPSRILLPESFRIPVRLGSDYIDHIISMADKNSQLTDESLPSDSYMGSHGITNS
jgi:hypothetical protein